MFKKSMPALALILFAATTALHAQAPQAPRNPPLAPETTKEDNKNDEPQPNRFWQAKIKDGHYMVALDRISAISRHKYLLDGSVIVDEVTVDALGQALARFYFLTPVSGAVTGNAAGNTASRIVERARDIVDKTADEAGTDIHNMVIKKFPETTHAHTIEYRVLSAEELSGLYSSVRTAWETGRGRKFTIK